ncbi:MAG: hypothetical protein ACE369_14405 [Roseovarius sp.]
MIGTAGKQLIAVCECRDHAGRRGLTVEGAAGDDTLRQWQHDELLGD